MKVKYFPDTDTAHVEFTDKGVHETRDRNGNLVSMTIEHAKTNADLWEFSYQDMAQQAS